MVLTANTSLPLGLASISATAVFIVNTTGVDVVFNIPGGATDPNRPTGLSLTIPKAAPANPSGILNHSQSDADLQALITGSPTWAEGSPGPYGIVFLAGQLELLSVLELDVSGYVLLSEDVVSLEANFSAAGSFFNLASASARGTLFFSSQGEFVVDVGGAIQLGPDGFNISGSADLVVSYLDSDGRGSQGDGPFVLDVQGRLAVSAEIFYIDVGTVSVDVAYNSDSGVITVGIDYPQPYWTKACTKVWLVGTVCVYYPRFRTATYTFEVGKMTIEPPVLGQVDANGLLTLNVGPLAGARNLAVSEINEGVVIGDVSGGSERGRQISITMFGLTQAFDNVTRVLISDMGDGNDVVDILAGVQTEVEVHLGDGDDRLRNAGSATVIAYGGGGNDQLSGGSASDQLFGGPGDDVIAGGGGQDVLEGGPGADEFIIMASNLELSHINGGEDEDKITVVRESSVHDLRVTVDNNAGRIAAYLDNVETGSVTFANIENIMISGGFEQEDFVLWSEGSVVVSGTSGDDEIIVSSGSAMVTINGASTSFSGAAVKGVLVDGQDGDDVILVDASVFIPTVLYGNNGNDILQGGSGDDVVEGGEGNDKLDGGAGNDTARIKSGDKVTVKEGHTANIVASFSRPQSATIDWGDGSPLQDGAVADGTVSASHIYADNSTYTVTVTATDEDGGSDTRTFEVSVINVNPTVNFTGSSLNLGANGYPVPFSGVRGQTLYFDGNLSDPGFDNPDNHPHPSVETFTYIIHWGDGTTDDAGDASIIKFGSRGVLTTGSFGGSHVYAEEGTYTIVVTVTDDDGGSTTIERVVTIAIASMQVGGDLAVGGTIGPDAIEFRTDGKTGGIEVLMGGVVEGTYQPTGRLLAFGQAGDDDIQVAGNITLSVWLYGDDGADRLKGGAGNDVLMGGAGDDLLLGQSGRDLMIGGLGADRMVGNSDDDLLIAGYTAFDYDYGYRAAVRPDGLLHRMHNDALSALVAEWTSQRDYFTRIENISGVGTNSFRENGNFFLKTLDDPATDADEQTVFDDDARDFLTGSQGDDWFFFNFGEDKDKATDLRDEVFANDLGWIDPV